MTRPRTIVVADDDLLFSTQIEAAVARQGHRATVVRTAADFERALVEGPDAAVVNLAASAIDAIEAIRRAKRNPVTRTIPVLGFCGHADTARRRDAQDAGCDRVATNGEVSSNFPRLLEALLGGVPATEQRYGLKARPTSG